MSTQLEGAKNQLSMIAASINGSSSAMQTLGNIGADPHPERMLAVGLAHAQNAIALLVEAVEELERKTNRL